MEEQKKNPDNTVMTTVEYELFGPNRRCELFKQGVRNLITKLQAASDFETTAI